MVRLRLDLLALGLGNHLKRLYRLLVAVVIVVVALFISVNNNVVRVMVEGNYGVLWADNACMVVVSFNLFSTIESNGKVQIVGA